MKTIENYPNYQVTEDGKIWSLKSNKFLKPYKNTNGYLSVSLYNEDGRKTHTIHRIVAETFIKKPENYNDTYTVDHINRIITDNRVENLRWATKQQQVENRDPEKVKKVLDKASEINSKQIEMRDKNNHSILYKTFSSAYQAAIQEFGDKQKNSLIHRCAKGKKSSAYGYWWCYSN